MKTTKKHIKENTRSTEVKSMEVHQLSKINGVYWWTGTSILTYVPEEDAEYKWTSDIKIVQQLNGKKI